MTGPSSADPFVTSIAKNAESTRRFSSVSSGARRFSAVPIAGDCSGLSPLFSVYFVVTGTALRVINLDVLRRCFHQLLMRTCRKDLTLHQQDDLIIIFDRRNFLSDRQERNTWVITMDVLEDFPFGIRVNARSEIVEQQ